MKSVINNVFSGVRPDAVQFFPDEVVVNSNIRYVERIDEGEDRSYYVADSVFYTYQEYTAIQEGVIAAQKSINEEQDELIAEILEGQ